MHAAESVLGPQFAQAMACKDFDLVGTLVAEDIDFRGLTPRRSWQATSSADLISDVLRTWLGESDVIEEVLEVKTGVFADRQYLAYKFRGHNEDGDFVVEQHAYFTESDGRIDWMRILCSGFRTN